MRKILFLISIVAASMFSTALAAVGDQTTIVDQTFAEGTTLGGTGSYEWGTDIQDMIQSVTSKDGSFEKWGLNVTNTSDAGNYKDREFLTFLRPLGSSTEDIEISYLPECPQDRVGNNANFEIDYFNENNELVFGIQETSGGWKFYSTLIYKKEDGSTETLELPAHLAKHTGTTVNISVKFNGTNAIINVGDVSATAYTSSQGIKSIKFTVSGTGDDGRGMVLQNFVVKTTEVEAAQYAAYTIKYVCDGQPIDGKEDVIKSGEVGSTVSLSSTETENFKVGDLKYIYVSDDASGKTVAADDSTVVTLTYREAATYNYTVKSNVNDGIIASGSTFEGESVTIPYNRYIIAEDRTVWMRDASNKEYNYSFTPTSDNYVETLSYSATDMKDGLYFIEAEDIDGVKVVTNNNANIRCSNSAGAYADTAAEVCKLGAGKYKVIIAVLGNTGATITVKAGEKEVVSAETQGWWLDATSEEFTITEETAITFEGATSSKPLDYILITGTVNVTGIAINGKEGTKLENLDLTKDAEYQLSAVITPENASNKAVTWSSSDEAIATVDKTGKVTAVKGGSATITVTSEANAKITASVPVNVTVPATGLSVQDKDKNTLESGNEIQLTLGETYTLEAVVAPEGSTDMVVWTTSNAEVATVENGKITTINAGDATITATVATFSVAVKVVIAEATVPVTGVRLDQETAEMKTGGQLKLTATIEPKDASSKNVAWLSSDENFATVDQNGNVEAVKAGTVTITASAGDFSAECVITITDIEVTGITLDQTEIKNLVKGETVKLTATVEPSDATDPTVTWSTSDETIATVDQDGNVNGIAAGTATITATAGEESATCEVTVIVPVDGIALNFSKLTVETGDEFTVAYTISPEVATDQTVTWTSNNEEVATVDENGNVTALAAGEAVITAKAGAKEASCTITVVSPEETDGVRVRMTYVDMNNPATPIGIIKKGESARSGYNKISGGSVIFANEDWGVNYITYIQVDASAIKDKYITSATLSFDASGPGDDKKRNTDYGVGYNESVWSVGMTYNTADPSITTIGDLKSNSTYSSSQFVNLSFDITEAINNAEGRIATILVYETAAAGGYIKNPVVQIESTNELVYNVTFAETSGAEGVKVTVNDQDATNGLSLPNGTYSFTATASHCKDYAGEFTVANEDLNVEFEMTEKELWSYTVKNNVNGEEKTGTCYEGESPSVFFNKYILAEDGTVWSKEVANNKTHEVSITPDKDGYVYTLEYSETDIKDGIFFKEAEDEYYTENNVLTAIATTGNRGSNKLGGYTDEESATLYTLLPGTYNIEIGAIGPAADGAILVVKAGEEAIITTSALYSTLGKYSTSSPVTISTETDLTIEGTNSKNVLDYILITGKVYTPATGITLEESKTIEYDGETVKLTATVTPANTTDAITWSSSDSKVATVDAEGNVTAVGVGNVTITAKAGEFSATCAVKVYPQLGDADWNGGISTNDAIHIANYVVGKNTVKDEMKEFYLAGADVNKDNSVSISDASATVELALKDGSEPAANTIALLSLNAPEDNLVIGGLNASANGGSTVAVTLDNTMDYVALQADIYVPEGVNFDVKPGSRIADSHSFQYYRFDESHVRVAIYTFSGNAFADNNKPLFEIVADSSLSDASDISLVKILASDADANEYVLGARYAIATGVEAIGLDGNAPVKVYDLNGRYISDKVEGLAKGIYIICQGNDAKKVNIR